MWSSLCLLNPVLYRSGLAFGTHKLKWQLLKPGRLMELLVFLAKAVVQCFFQAALSWTSGPSATSLLQWLLVGPIADPSITSSSSYFGFTSFDLFLQVSSDIVDKILADWGQSLFRAGRSLGDFSEGILCVVDCRRSLQGHLQRS